MKTRLFLAAALILALAACKKEENTSTDTATTATMVQNDTTGTNTGTGSTGGTASTLADADKEFVMKAAAGGMAEVSMGNLAVSQGSSADVKSFGTRMVSDHGKANDELAELATNKGLSLPAELDAEHKNKQDELSKKSGKDFDKAYAAAMVEDHEKDVAEFEKAANSAQDADLKAWAAKTLPTLQDHLKMAKELKGKVK